MKNYTHIVRSLRRPFLFCAIIVALLASIPATVTNHVEAQGRRYSLRIQNNSRYDIYRLYVSSSDEDRWGPDQLRDDVLETGSAYTLTNIRPGEYDIKFVDEDGDTCILRDIAIFKDTSWVLTTRWLLNCESR